MPTYRHTQVGTLLLVALGGSLVLLVPLMALTGATLAAPWTAVVVVALCLANFYALTVEITPDALTVALGPGLIRRRFPIAHILGARRVRNAWYNGWGIRLTESGWLWNVSGYDAVELELANGRRFRIGTDDVEGLLTAIQAAQARGVG